MEKKTRSNSNIPKKMKTSSLCMPRLKSNNKNKRLSPVTLLERLREAVFRLIMISALTKAASHHHHAAGSTAVPRRYYPADAHHSEAVADCIEFIKRKASTREENRDSSASSSNLDATNHEVVVPVPVM